MSPSKKRKKKVSKLVLEPTPEIPLIPVLANNFLNQLGLVDFINRSVIWDVNCGMSLQAVPSFKQPAFAAVISLKTPNRIDALVMLLRIRGLMRYKIRKSMQERQEELPRIGPNKGKLKSPTTNYLIEELGRTALRREASGRYTYILLINTVHFVLLPSFNC